MYSPIMIIITFITEQQCAAYPGVCRPFKCTNDEVEHDICEESEVFCCIKIR